MKRITATLAVLTLALASIMFVSCQSNELVRSDHSVGLNGGFELTAGDRDWKTTVPSTLISITVRSIDKMLLESFARLPL